MGPIKNITKGAVVSKDHVLCRTMLSKARGLMFSRKKTLVFVFDKEQKVPLHMLFVFFPISAIYLDKNKRIVEKAVLKPFISYYNPKNNAKYIIESPYLDIIADKGDKIDF